MTTSNIHILAGCKALQPQLLQLPVPCAPTFHTVRPMLAKMMSGRESGCTASLAKASISPILMLLSVS